MGISITRTALIAAMACVGAATTSALAADKDPINPAPTAQDWQALAKPPGWRGARPPLSAARQKGSDQSRPDRAGLAGARQAAGLERGVDAGDQRSGGA